MKNLVLLCFFNLVHSASTSQVRSSADQGIVSDVIDIASFSDKSASSLFVKSELRGGSFALYTGSDPVDDGMIFRDALNRKWLRKTDGASINVQWYGLQPYAVGLSKSMNDCYIKFMAAVGYVYSHKQFNTIIIPYSNKGTQQYYFTKTIVLDKDIKIEGEGVNGNPKTILLFPPNTKGFFLNSPVATFISIKNLRIEQETVTDQIDSLAHGIESRVFTHLTNIYINNVSGDGVRISACATKGSPIEGNADQSVIENVQTYNCMNGLYIEGCDANVIDINNCSFVHSKRWGVYDNGMLGNLYRNCHFSNNGKQGGVAVTYKNEYYAPVNELYNSNKRPDQNPEYWYKIAPVGGATPWEPSRRYWSGGVAIVANVNASSRFDHCYSESFQPPAILNNRSTYESGNIGSEVRGGVLVRVLNGVYIIYSSNKTGTQVDKLGVGESPATFSISALGADFQLMRLTSPQVFTELRMANKVDNYGGITYYDSSMLFISKGEYTTATTQTSFFPFKGNNKMDLGQPSNAWRTIYGGTVFSTRAQIGGAPSRVVSPSTLQVNGSFAASYVAKTADYAITENDYTVDCIANSFTVTLPSAEGITGRMYIIINSGSGIIKVVTTGRQTIGNSEKAPQEQSVMPGQTLRVQSTGAKWRVL